MAKKLETLEENNKQLLKELEDELNQKKEDIIKELEEKVEKEINASINKRMKEEEKRILRGKNGKIIRRDILIVLLCAAIGYFGYCLYKVDYFKIRKPITENNPVTNNEQNHKIENNNEEPKIDYIKEYGYLVNNLIINDESVYRLMNNIDSSSISNDLKLKVGYKNLENKTEEDGVITFSSIDLKEEITKIFGQIDYKDSTFTYNKTRFMYHNEMYIGYKESEESSNFVYLITSGKKEKDELVFELICGKLIDKELVNLDDEVVTKKYNDDSLEKYAEKLNHITISFSQEKDNYIFSNIKKN